MNQSLLSEAQRSVTATDTSVAVPIHLSGNRPGLTQPFTVGVPFPPGLLSSSTRWALSGQDGTLNEVQHHVQSCWPDGSLQWLQIHFSSRQLGGSQSALLQPLNAESAVRLASHRDVLRIQPAESSGPLSSVTVDTGHGKFILSTGETWLQFMPPTAPSGRSETGCRLLGHDARGRRQLACLDSLAVDEAGPSQATVAGDGRLGRSGLRLSVRLTFHAGSNLIRLQLTLHNPRRARHRGGYWDLGDPGSVRLRDWSLEIPIARQWSPQIQWLEQPQSQRRTSGEPSLEIYQDSSGGPQWQSRNHQNHAGRLPQRFRGYRVRIGGQESGGLRATPTIALVGAENYLACALEEFWQQFPSALEVQPQLLRVGLWPAQFGDLHELQGGEQNTRVIWLELGRGTAWQSLTWVHEPAVAVVDPAWLAASGGVPFFPTNELPRRPQLETLLSSALHGEHNLFAKREAIDEYGWRNFGDCWADHEEAHATDPRPVISHFNNQYDLLHSLLLQFLQSGDIRWWRLADPLARHVLDIDIYRTRHDKAAYNGGLFWHTAHYHDAARCSHRSYSRAMSGKSLPAPGGGPANEHNYSSGLLLYYRLSGNRQAAEAVISLADWVLAMDDGRQHLLGCVSSVPTGLATCTRCLHHQGPGRGAGNSIVSLVNAWLVCGQTNYLDQAAELLRRTISPEDDLSEDQLLDAEEHWSYTVYLQALVFFLHATEGLAEYRDAGSYARQSVLHYARWMMAHERPYLDHAEDLEYPTETWAAQDLRKGVVLWMAAALCSEEAERETLQRKGEALLSQAWNSLLSFSTRSCTRPLALVLQQSPLERYFCPLAQQPRRQLSAPPPPADFRPSPVFVPQRILVARQLKSPPQLALMMLRLMRPGPWMQLGRRSWTAERLRHLLRPGP